VPVILTADAGGEYAAIIPFHAFARLQVVVDGARSAEAVFVGASFPHATIEAPINADGQLDILAPAGRHPVYIRRHPVALQWLTVEADVEDAGTVRLVL
jgi:hypothetical protein